MRRRRVCWGESNVCFAWPRAATRSSSSTLVGSDRRPRRVEFALGTAAVRGLVFFSFHLAETFTRSNIYKRISTVLGACVAAAAADEQTSAAAQPLSLAWPSKRRSGLASHHRNRNSTFLHLPNLIPRRQLPHIHLTHTSSNPTHRRYTEQQRNHVESSHERR